MNSNNYWVEVAEEGKKSKAIGPFNTEAEAIAKAREVAWDVDQRQYWITVNDADGNSVWDNEGDWLHAIR